MMDDNAQQTLSEADFALAHALQLYPRVSWSRLAPVLDAAPVTLARRWERLRESGHAWVNSYPVVRGSAMQVALVEVDCAPGRLEDAATALEAMPAVMSIEYAARGRDLLLTVNAPSFTELSGLVLDRLGHVPGVTSTRTHLAAAVHVEGSRWRLDALDGDQIEAVRALRRADTAPPADPVDLRGTVYGPIVRELGADGRAGAAEIAARIGRPASTVRRQLATLVRSRSLVFRCEIAQLLTRWPISVAWWIRLPTADVGEAVRRVGSDPRVRLCLSLTGPANFLVNAWTHALPELVGMQSEIERALPAAEIVDTSVTLRTRKRMGWLLHPDGRCTGRNVPLFAERAAPPA
ncbi:Lrp/AsnC family transcriptional regulator [Pseudonocardia parietis]|uniref:DNA-binding Lrp family transcriptional regulator n=1 Tax=Pseudonocardia parietis TaxID=570936 RepID=A0ABS4VZM1_9PSEU|nr:Lrp/AsnC family transcriptional regulator [Pseudonocardia parietis]MBP2368904.1 DNA-binding Lrp family transcriptional regulator [Pseudonocardia parietis]